MLLKPTKTRTRNRQSEVRGWEETQETPWETTWVITCCRGSLWTDKILGSVGDTGLERWISG